MDCGNSLDRSALILSALKVFSPIELLESFWVPEFNLLDLTGPVLARKIEFVAQVVVQIETVVNDVCLMN